MTKHCGKEPPLEADEAQQLQPLHARRERVVYLDLCECGLNGRQQLLYKGVVHLVVGKVLLHTEKL